MNQNKRVLRIFNDNTFLLGAIFGYRATVSIFECDTDLDRCKAVVKEQIKALEEEIVENEKKISQLMASDE